MKNKGGLAKIIFKKSEIIYLLVYNKILKKIKKCKINNKKVLIFLKHTLLIYLGII